MERSGDGRILTTHTGSLPRSPELLELLLAKEADRTYDHLAFEKLVRSEVDRTVQQQVEAGVDIVNDGEQGKASFSSYRLRRLSGFELVDTSSLPEGSGIGMAEAEEYPEFYANLWQWSGAATNAGSPSQTLCCTGAIGWSDFSEVERDLDNLRSASAEVHPTEVFMTAISPATYAPPNLYYRTEGEYLEALADAMAREYEAIIAAGFILQIDAPDLTTMFRLSHMTRDEHQSMLEIRVDTINRAVRDLPEDRIRVHVCWGADEAPHHLDVPLKDIVAHLVRLRPQGLAVPGANGRHSHEWAVWKDVPLAGEKVLIPGVVDSTTNIIEHPEAVAERLVRYAQVLGPERVIAGVDCGFGTVAAVAQVDPRIVFAKLHALAQGAELAARQVW
jgi:5-methyltetrahydropteroyltriglutamate--homocysteine methyltransferase